MKRLLILALCLGAIAAWEGCGRKPAPQPKEGEKDYRVMLDRARQRKALSGNVQALQNAVRDFQVDMGRFPSNLYEVVRVGYIKDIPALPEGLGYSYDPVFGNIGVGRLPPQSAQQAPAQPPPPQP